MEKIDFFCFPSVLPIEKDLLNLKTNQLKTIEENLINKNISHANVAIFDQNVLKNRSQIKLIKSIIKRNLISFGVMLDYNDLNIKKNILKAKKIGFKSIIFHPYIQKIKNSELNKFKKIAKYISQSGLLISICCAYGGKEIYNFYPLKLVNYIAQFINTPIIIIHAGGAKIIDAMLLAETYSNIYIDTSFSLNYYVNSTIEKDFAYLINKIGSNRVLFGTDFPFCNVKDTIMNHNKFFKKYNFNNRDKKQILYSNSKRLLNL